MAFLRASSRDLEQSVLILVKHSLTLIDWTSGITNLLIDLVCDRSGLKIPGRQVLQAYVYTWHLLWRLLSLIQHAHVWGMNWWTIRKQSSKNPASHQSACCCFVCVCVSFFPTTYIVILDTTSENFPFKIHFLIIRFLVGFYFRLCFVNLCVCVCVFLFSFFPQIPPRPYPTCNLVTGTSSAGHFYGHCCILRFEHPLKKILFSCEAVSYQIITANRLARLFLLYWKKRNVRSRYFFLFTGSRKVVVTVQGVKK